MGPTAGLEPGLNKGLVSMFYLLMVGKYDLFLSRKWCNLSSVIQEDKYT